MRSDHRLLTRREFTSAVSMVLASGCAAGKLGPPKHVVAPRNCFTVHNATELTVDVHCHIFNGVDVPVRRFTGPVVLDNDGLLGWLAGAYVRLTTRTVSTEDECCPREGRCRTWPFASSENACKSFDDHHPKVGGGWGLQRARRRMGDYRLFNAIALLDAYPSVHLFTPAMVDLYGGLGLARENIRSQRYVYADLVTLSSGRILPFIGFDPLREAEYRYCKADPHTSCYEIVEGSEAKKKTLWSQLDVVKDCVLNHGFVGVKLYPAMGFVPLGNANNLCARPSQRYLSTRAFRRYKKDEVQHLFGSTVDEVLKELYQWCCDNDVCVMAHCNDSNYAYAACAEKEHEVQSDDDFGSPCQWEAVLTHFPTLRLNLGHCGGLLSMPAKNAKRRRGLDPQKTTRDAGVVPSYWASEIAKMIESAKYPNLFADLAYFDEALNPATRAAVATAVAEILRSPNVSARIMYGSDWHMLIRQREWQQYLDVVRSVLPPERRSAVMGTNAINFLGLTRGQRNRERVDRVLGPNVEPPWKELVDA